MAFDIVAEQKHKDPRIISDQTVRMSNKDSAEKYPGTLRRVTAIVEVDGKDKDEDRPPRSPADLWDSRWPQAACDCRETALFPRI